jgi:predicted ATPase with chaperone activity
MTHPTLTAIDDAIATHGWPDDVAMISLTNPPHGCRVISAHVTLGEIAGDGAYRGTAGTLTNALEAARLEHAKYVAPIKFAPDYLRSVKA